MLQYTCLGSNLWCGQDVDQYKDYSDSIIAGHGFSARTVTNMYFINPKERIYVPETLRLPAFSYILSLGRRITNTPRILLYINLTSYALIGLYVYLLARRLLNKWYALICLLLVFFSATLLFYATQLGGVDVFVTCTVMGFVYHISVIKDARIRLLHSALAVLWGILTIFSRQNTIVLVTIIGCYYVLLYWRSPIRRCIIGVLSIFVACILLWMLRNYIVSGKPTLSLLGGEQIFAEHIYFTPFQNEDTKRLLVQYSNEKNTQFVAQQRSHGKNVNSAYATLTSILQRETTYYVISHRRLTIEQFFQELGAFFLSPTFSWGRHDIFLFIRSVEYYLNTLYLWIIFLFALLYYPLRKYIRHDMAMIWLSCTGFIFLSSFAHGIVIGNRGVLPVVPLLSILTCYFCLTLVDVFKRFIIYYAKTH